MRVLINGGGNIGTTLANVLLKHKNLLAIEEIILHKHFPQPWTLVDLDFLERNGIQIFTKKEIENVLPNVDYIFETTANGIGIKNKSRYEQLTNLKGCSAQGSEKHFGIPYMIGINDDVIRKEKFVHIVSCNTHSALALLNLVSNQDLERIQSADFVVVRRSEDLGNHQRLVTANVVARHLDEFIGTHHAIDVVDLLKTVNISIPITSSDITTPSQLMHTTRFSITLNEPIVEQQLRNSLMESKYIASTKKFDSNLIFELGRRYGFQGRIFSHVIVIDNNIMIHSNTVKGWAFVPQEGNTILSTIQAFLLQMNYEDGDRLMNRITADLFIREW